MFYVSVTLFEIPKRSIKILVRNPSSPVFSRSRHWLLGPPHGRRAAPLQALRLSASRSHLRKRTVPRLLSASRVFFLLLLCPGPGPSCKFMSRAFQKNRSIRSLRTAKAHRLLAEARRGISTCGSKAVTCIAYGISGNHLISGSEDGMVRIWDAITHNIVRMFKHANGYLNAI
ncbi:protein ROOT INITIATION DEFECTIVE 3-like isoform X1 [Malus domestica]|uniref:protein ROOT INITIATION DEFECTIVE 3-like isoform X1 n=1 Tax=Malus domestica TaxID=3750 RepID=UPI0004991D70|nr:protein ROOT INITIATION DEFECTIVE 3-like isoform X1 [Malus domestica]